MLHQLVQATAGGGLKVLLHALYEAPQGCSPGLNQALQGVGRRPGRQRWGGGSAAGGSAAAAATAATSSCTGTRGSRGTDSIRAAAADPSTAASRACAEDVKPSAAR